MFLENNKRQWSCRKAKAKEELKKEESTKKELTTDDFGHLKHLVKPME